MVLLAAYGHPRKGAYSFGPLISILFMPENFPSFLSLECAFQIRFLSHFQSKGRQGGSMAGRYEYRLTPYFFYGLPSYPTTKSSFLVKVLACSFSMSVDGACYWMSWLRIALSCFFVAYLGDPSPEVLYQEHCFQCFYRFYRWPGRPLLSINGHRSLTPIHSEHRFRGSRFIAYF